MAARWEIDRIKKQLVDIVIAEKPLTKRGAFYRAVSAGLFPSTGINDYSKCLRYLNQLLEVERIDDEMFIDTTRIRHESTGFPNPASFLQDVGLGYSRYEWIDQPIHLEVFSEKDAMTSILAPIIERFNVPLNILRGNSSRKFLHDIGERWLYINKPIHCLYLGDFDPSGINIARNTFKRLRVFAKDRSKTKFTWSKVAVSPADFARMQHLTVGIKPSDLLSQRYIEEFGTDRCLEVDAIPSNAIRTRLALAIEKRIDKDQWQATLDLSKLEQDKFQRLNTLLQQQGLDRSLELLEGENEQD